MDLDHFPTSPAARRMLASVSEEFYAKAYTAKWLYQVMGQEWDAVWEIIDSLPEQTFVETATWGLKYHELKWGLPVRENLSYETRRRLIYEKRDVRKPMNPWAMERIIFDMTGRASRVSDSHDNPNIPANTFVVEIESGETELDICAVLNKLRAVKQSHVAFVFLIVARVKVRISTPSNPYAFPYRLAGEHPEINVWGGVERGNIQAETDGRGHLFPYPVTGPHLAGTIPEESTLGFIRYGAAEVGAAGASTVFPYAPAGENVTGTLPDTNIPAFIRKGGLEAAASGEWRVFPYIQTGTRPETNTAGHVRRSAVRNEVETSGIVFPYTQSGTRPDTNVEGGQDTAGIVNRPAGDGTVFSYAPAGEAEAGTLPDNNVPGALRGLLLQNAASGSGAVFPYPSAGLETAGIIPEEQTLGTGNGAELNGTATGAGIVIEYPLCGDDD